MSVNSKSPSWLRVVLAAMLVSATFACGPRTNEPSDWMLGVFNTGALPGTTDRGFAKYDIRDDHTARKIIVDGCGQSGEEVGEPFPWESRGKESIAFVPRDGETKVLGYDEWIVELGDTCDVLEVHQVQTGEVVKEYELYRGDVCLEQLPPCDPPGSECDSCEAVWCTEPPEPCGE